MPVIIEGTPPEHDPRLNHLKVTPDPGVIEVNLHPARNWPEIVHQTSTLYDEARETPARHGEVHARRPSYRDGRGQSPGARRRDRGGQSVPAAARSPAQPARLLEQPPVALVPVLGPLLRTDEPASTRGRRAERFAPRARNRVRAGAGAPGMPAVACRSGLPASARRSHRQYASRRVLHRQALRAGNEQRPAGAGRAAVVRDATARADEPGAAAPAARARCPLLEDALQSDAGPLEHGAPRSLHAAALRRRRSRRRRRRSRTAAGMRCSCSGSRRTWSSAFPSTVR